jgi:hypothetical protein
MDLLAIVHPEVFSNKELNGLPYLKVTKKALSFPLPGKKVAPQLYKISCF